MRTGARSNAAVAPLCRSRRLPVVPGYLGSPAFPWRAVARLWSRSRFHVERLPALRGRGAGAAVETIRGPLDARCEPEKKRGRPAIHNLTKRGIHFHLQG